MNHELDTDFDGTEWQDETLVALEQWEQEQEEQEEQEEQVAQSEKGA